MGKQVYLLDNQFLGSILRVDGLITPSNLSIVSTVVSMPAFQAGDPGSIPGRCIARMV